MNKKAMILFASTVLTASIAAAGCAANANMLPVYQRSGLATQLAAGEADLAEDMSTENLSYAYQEKQAPVVFKALVGTNVSDKSAGGAKHITMVPIETAKPSKTTKKTAKKTTKKTEHRQNAGHSSDNYTRNKWIWFQENNSPYMDCRRSRNQSRYQESRRKEEYKFQEGYRF